AGTRIENEARDRAATALHLLGEAVQRARFHLDRRTGDENAASDARFHQPAPLERFQGMARRHAAGAELVGDLAFGGHAVAALQRARTDLLLKPAGDALVEREVVSEGEAGCHAAAYPLFPV